MRTLRTSARAGWLVLAVALATTAAAATGSSGAGRRAVGGAASRPAQAPSRTGRMPADLAPVVAAELAPDDFHLAPAPGGWQAANPTQGLSVGFSAEGVHLSPTAGGPSLGLSLAAVGRGDDLSAPAPASPEANGARVDYHRGSLTEWYVNDQRGVEQGFTLNAPPAGGRDRPVVVDLAPSGGLRPTLESNGSAVRFDGGGTTVHYRDLSAVDASGRTLPAGMALSGGALRLTVDDTGAAYPVTIDPLVATLQAQLVDPDGAIAGAEFDEFGSAVAVSGDTAVVGSAYGHRVTTPSGTANLGSANVFVRAGGAWVLQGRLFDPDPPVFNQYGDGAADGFGLSVAISGDTVVVGAQFQTAPGGAEAAGAAFVFVRSGALWTLQSELPSPDVSAGAYFGMAVAVSGDTAVVDGRGASADVFVRSGGTWTEQARLPVRLNGRQLNTSISGDTIAFAGGGTAQVFVRSGASWALQAELPVPDTVFYSAAISGDTLVVGAGCLGSVGGVADVFVRSGTTWALQAELTPSDGQACQSGFGESVSVSGDTVVLGGPYLTFGIREAGVTYVFVRVGTTWVQQAELMSPQPSKGGDFGYSVGVSANNVVVGSPGLIFELPALKNGGYVFHLTRQSRPGVVTSSTSWSLRDLLTTGPAAAGPFTFGSRPQVPLMGDWNGDGTKTPGVFAGGTFYLRNSNTPGPPDITFSFGDARGFPVAGDWNGDGIDTVGVYRNGTFTVTNVNAAGPPAATIAFGPGGSWPMTVPVAGDWNGDGVDGVGTYSLADGTWNLRQTTTAGPPDIAPFVYWTGPGSYPVVGDWEPDGTDTVGVRHGATWSLNSANDASAPDITFDFGTGAGDELPIVWAS